MTAAMYVPQFVVRQKITMMVNRYQVFASNPDGSQGPLMALAEQKRMAFKEQVTFFTDESRTRPVFGFKARRKLDLNAGYDVTDEQGQQIGFFRKDFGASLLLSRVLPCGSTKSKCTGRNEKSVNRRSSATPWLRSCPVPEYPGPSTWKVDRSSEAPKSFLKKPICWPCSSVTS